MAITFTTTDLDNLKAALLTGAQEVTIGDRKIVYRSQAQLLQAIKMVQTFLDGAATEDAQPSLIQATFKKGVSS